MNVGHPLCPIFPRGLPDEKHLFFSPPAGVAKRFVSGPLVCATNPVGLGRGTNTPRSQFSVPLVRGSSDDPRSSPELAFDLIVVAGGLLHGAVLGLLHGLNQRDPAPGRLSQ